MRADFAVWEVGRPPSSHTASASIPARPHLPGAAMTDTLIPGAVTLAELEAVWRARHARAPRSRGAAGHQSAPPRAIGEMAAGAAPVYGVNTGFGKLAPSASTRRRRDAPAQPRSSRTAAASASRCRPRVVRLDARAQARLARPRRLRRAVGSSSASRGDARSATSSRSFPGQGSVGASGDLAPLAHMAAAMIGEGEATHDGERLPAAEALARGGARAASILAAKEGLALINGTQVSTALALAGLFVRLAGGCRRRWSPARSRPMPPWAPPRRSTRRSTRCAATGARSTPPRRWCGLLGGLARSARATAKAIPASRIPTASAASRRSPARRST